MKTRFLLIFLLFICSFTEAGLPVSDVYVRPSESFIKRKSWKKIEKGLKERKIPQKSIDFLKQIPPFEDWGHIGYHGSTHSYRIYQDIIRMVVEEILSIKIREDFHFLRVPGDKDLNLNSIEEFVSFWGKDRVNNRNKTRAKQLLSLNFCLYAHYKSSHNSAVYYFVKNSSSNEDIDYSGFLEPFFVNLGIDVDTLKLLFKIGEKWLADERGTLLQISENSHLSDPSHEAYNFADIHAYPSRKKGYRYGHSAISVHYQRLMTEEYVRKKVKIAPQLRLLMSNRYTLNPYSHLIVRRWEEAEPAKIADYEAELRAAIQSLPFDLNKAAQLRENLLKQWVGK